MIELTEGQRQELNVAEPLVVDPLTRETYVLVRKEVYERMKGLLYDAGEVPDEELRLLLARSATANGWNEPAMADYDNYDAKRAEQCPTELLTPQELADAAPFYFALRDYIRQLKEAREVAGLTLAEVAARTGMAVESLSRLETGAQTNPTWKTLATYAAAVGRRPRLTAEVVPTDGSA